MKKKLTVITDDKGRVLGTQLGHGDEAAPKSGIRVSVVAGERQHLHRIEYEVPEFRSAADIQAFHKGLAQHLKTAT